MKSIQNKQAKEIYERHVKIAEQTDITEDEKIYRKQRMALIEYLVGVYEHMVEDTTTLQNIFPSFERYQNIELLHFQRPLVWSKNENILICFSFFQKIFHNTQESMIERIQASVCMEITRNMMFLYEMKMELHEDDVNDMFLVYDEYFRPLFPEELLEAAKDIKRK